MCPHFLGSPSGYFVPLIAPFFLFLHVPCNGVRICVFEESATSPGFTAWLFAGKALTRQPPWEPWGAPAVLPGRRLLWVCACKLPTKGPFPFLRGAVSSCPLLCLSAVLQLLPGPRLPRPLGDAGPLSTVALALGILQEPGTEASPPEWEKQEACSSARGAAPGPASLWKPPALVGFTVAGRTAGPWVLPGGEAEATLRPLPGELEDACLLQAACLVSPEVEERPE